MTDAGRLRGRVDHFDAGVGLGVVVTGAGERYPFHCTQIAGGSRDIEEGADVEFVIRAARQGRFEAGGVTPKS